MLVVPQLPVHARRIVPDMQVIVELLRRIRVGPIRPINQARVAENNEFGRIARSEEWMIDDHVSRSIPGSVQVGLGAGALFVDDLPSPETVQAEPGRCFVGRFRR